MDVYAYKNSNNMIYIHPIDTPVYTESTEDVFPRLEVRGGVVRGWPGGNPIRIYDDKASWIKIGILYKCKLIEGKLL